MDNSHPPQELQVFRTEDSGMTEIDLSGTKPADFFKNDLVRVQITGSIPREPDYRLVNFVESVLYNTIAEDVDFTECDFKDTQVKNSTFARVKFDNGTFATSFLSDCTFHDCTFYNTAVYNSEFHCVTFRHCDLAHLLIKHSRFVECAFIDCTTSNRLIEMSTLDGTYFEHTDIQLQTITGNFGLTRHDIVNSRIRSDQLRENFSFLSEEDLRNYFASPRLSPIEKLRIEYFLNPDLTLGSEYLDESLNLSRWTRVYKNPGSFTEMLERFSEFIVNLYENDRITMQAILLLHHVTSTLTAGMNPTEDAHRLALSLGGTHLVLSRIVESFLETLQFLAGANEKSIVFLVDGPNDKEFFYKELAFLFQGSDVEITNLVVHNSPLDLHLTAHLGTIIPFTAAFLATRTRLQIFKLRERASAMRASRSERSTALVSKRQPNREIDRLIAINAGMSPSGTNYEIQVKSLLPGSLLLDLRLQFGTKTAGKIRKVLLAILS